MDGAVSARLSTRAKVYRNQLTADYLSINILSS